MEFVLTVNSSVICVTKSDKPDIPDTPHGGIVKLKTDQTVLKVDGSYVLLVSDWPNDGLTVENCKIPTDSNSNSKQCLKALPPENGKSQILNVNGNPVLLLSTNGSTDGLDKGNASKWKVSSAIQEILQSD